MNARLQPLSLRVPVTAPVSLPAPMPGTGSGPGTALPRHDALALTAGGAQAQILLNGQVYSLRITRAGKLILTK